MADTTAHLVDHVLPHVAVRQWVLTLPIPLRSRVAFDHEIESVSSVSSCPPSSPGYA
jgi:hypothetical protein